MVNKQSVDIVHGTTARLCRAQQKLHDGKRALRDWVAEQEKQLDEEEKHIRFIEEAIDVECVDDTTLPPVRIDKKDELATLIEEAEKLLADQTSGNC